MKLGVEKSGVEMSFNPVAITKNLGLEVDFGRAVKVISTSDVRSPWFSTLLNQLNLVYLRFGYSNLHGTLPRPTRMESMEKS